MKTELLHPMQNGLRLAQIELEQMWKFLSNGGIFNCESLNIHDPVSCSLIAIVRMEDGLYYIRDGLHRVTLIHTLRELREDEYFVENRKYDDFRQMNLSTRWITPFDPITEVRLSDFRVFKEEALSMNGQIEDFILKNKHRYCTSRLPEHSLDAFSSLFTKL